MKQFNKVILISMMFASSAMAHTHGSSKVFNIPEQILKNGDVADLVREVQEDMGYGEMFAAELAAPQDQPSKKSTLVYIRFEGMDHPGQDCVVTIRMNKKLTRLIEVFEDADHSPAVDCYD